MMQTNREAALEFARGGLAALIVLGVFLIIVLNTGSPQSPQKGVESPRFEVVDKYKGCDVVRWEQKGLAEYKYFLHCSGNRP
jgi:hypothetical protein